MSRPIVLTLATAALVAGAGGAIAQQRPPAPKPLTLEELEARARQDSLDPEAHFRLALRYNELKRFDAEERELRASIALHRRFAPAYPWLGYLPYDRWPKLWADERKERVSPDQLPLVEESRRLFAKGFLVNPMMEFRILGANAPPEGLFVVPEYGRYTTEYLRQVGLGAFAWARYELAYSALNLWAERAYANQLVTPFLRSSFGTRPSGYPPTGLQPCDQGLRDAAQSCTSCGASPLRRSKRPGARSRRTPTIRPPCSSWG